MEKHLILFRLPRQPCTAKMASPPPSMMKLVPDLMTSERQRQRQRRNRQHVDSPSSTAAIKRELRSNLKLSYRNKCAFLDLIIFGLSRQAHVV